MCTAEILGNINDDDSGEEVLNATTKKAIEDAKLEALNKLKQVQSIASKSQQTKEWRKLLKSWHPDKNQDNIEVATAVFQFLQKGKSLLSI